MSEKKPEVVASIDIGSHALRMKIAQIHETGEVKTLELLRYPISLGRDTFTYGKVSFAAVDKTCEILQGFKQLMNDYKVKTYRIIATSAIREADNRDYILDQIRLKTGLIIDLISNSQERFLTYKAIRENLPNYQKFRNEGCMVLDLGSGSISVSIYNKSKLTFSQNIKLGSLRLRQILKTIEQKTMEYPKILEEFVASNIDRIKIFEPPSDIKNFIALGGNTKIISELTNKSGDLPKQKSITRVDFTETYNRIIHKPIHTLVKEYNLPYERATILIPSMIILKKFLALTTAEQIYTPLVSLRDGIISDIVDKKFNTKRNAEFAEDIVASARFMAERYKYDKEHSEDVEEKALFIFDNLQRLHGLGAKERFLLKLAAILHDTGKFLSFDQHYVHSYHVIMASNLMGMSEQDLEIIANVAKYHSVIVPRYSHKNFKKLSNHDKVIVAKLVAIIRMADALDRSHNQKIKNIKIELKENQLLIKGETRDNILLEEWTFDTKSEFFQEVFGVKPVLKIKRMIGNE